MNTVHTDDIEVVRVIKPNLKKGPWIAGGAPLKWYQGMPVGVSDIDVFCKSKAQATAVTKRLITTFATTNEHNSDNALTLGVSLNKTIFGDMPLRWKVQIITREYFTDMQSVIDVFDITVCQVATDGTEWMLGDNTAKDIREHNLRMTEPLRESSAKRLTKYWTYGYRPVDGLLSSLKEEHFEKTYEGDYGF